MTEKINPWGNELVKDYGHLFNEFGLQHVDKKLLEKIGAEYKGFRRGIVFAHRDFDKFVDAADKGKATAVMTGIKPSSEFHLGSKMTAEEIIFLQKRFRSKVFYCIADVEAYADNGIPLDESHVTAVDNVSDLLALGLDEKNAFFYKQSRNIHVANLAQIFARKTTLATLEALYGHQNLALYLAVLTQAGDILAPQLKEFGGPKHVVVPVGIDQDPHVRFSRDLAAKFGEEFGFVLPSSTYHKFFRALSGETKMSKRDPMGVMTLNDSQETAKKKIAFTFTGGRATAEEQRRSGGEPHKCVFYELMQFHFIEDDSELKKMFDECVSGANLCGECKKKFGVHCLGFLKAHQERKKKLKPKAEKLLEK